MWHVLWWHFLGNSQCRKMFATMRILRCRSIGFAVKQERTFAVSASSFKSEQRSYRVVVVGGGTSGCAIASKLASRFGKGKVGIVEPDDVSFIRINVSLQGLEMGSAAL